jgi:hypothetical protein
MYRALAGGLIGALLGGGVGVLVATAEEGQGPIFIAGNSPVTEEQVREKLQSEGWTNVQVMDEGRYFEATGSKDGKPSKITVDVVTGRLLADDDD